MSTETVLLLVVVTLAFGVGIGLVVSRRTDSTEWRLRALTAPPTNALGREQAGSLANLLLFLGEQSDVQSVFYRAVAWLVGQGEAQFAAIYSYDPAAHELIAPVNAGRTPPEVIDRYRMGVGIIGEVASARRAIYVEHLSLESRLGPIAPGMTAAYVLPLLHNTLLLGVLV